MSFLFFILLFSFFKFNLCRLKVVLVIIQSANTLPQFGQSFSSSSITDSSGKVLSKSVYSDTTGKKIINGIPQLDVDLLPPFLPNQIPGLDLPSSSPFNKPVVAIPATEVEPPLLPSDTQRNAAPTTTVKFTTTTTTTTPRTTTAARTTKTFAVSKFAPVEQRPAINNFVQQRYDGKEFGSYKNVGDDGSYKLRGQNDGSYKINGNDGKYRANGNDGLYRPKGNLGFYVHDNSGSYVPDDRGKYRAI